MSKNKGTLPRTKNIGIYIQMSDNKGTLPTNVQEHRYLPANKCPRTKVATYLEMSENIGTLPTTKNIGI